MWVRRVSLYRSLPLTAMESGLISGPALATAYAVGIQDNDSYGGDSCYLFETHQFKTIGEVVRCGDLHSGRPFVTLLPSLPACHACGLGSTHKFLLAYGMGLD